MLHPLAPSPSMLVEELRQGERDPLELVDALEARFALHEPGLAAFLPEAGRFERLRRDAADLMRRHPEPSTRPPLFGLPVGIKDNIHVDGFPTAVGSRLPTADLAGPEADCVKVLRAAGALLVGKTTCTELAFYAPGPTRNPRAFGHTPGGSSSGSAAAVAAGLCCLALGTQTIGSILRPAAYCGVVGYKPTYGRISCQGIVPLAPSVDHVGLLAADLALAELGAGLLCLEWRSVESFKRVLRRPILRGPVLGIPEGPYLGRVEGDTLRHFRGACRLLEDAGYTVRSVQVMHRFDDVEARHHELVAGEAARCHRRFLGSPLLAPATRELLEHGRRIDDALLDLARSGREDLRRELMARMDTHGIDLWIAPSATGPAPLGLGSTGDPVMSLPWTHAGLPCVSLPAGERGGLPLGIQLVGWPGDDAVLLAWAKAIEPILGKIG